MSETIADEPDVPATPALRERARPVVPRPVDIPGVAATTVAEAEMPTGSSTLASVMQQVAKLHGPMVMRKASVALQTFRHIPTGVFTIDMALHGGVPMSLNSMIYGWESSGKTTIAMRTVARAQRMFPDKQVVYIDVEGTFDKGWAICHGVDIERLLLVQPETGEQAVDLCDAVLRAWDTSMVVLDSIPALIPMKELEKSAEDSIVALQARLTGTLVRKAGNALLDERKKGHYPVLLLVNQWRNKIAMMGDPRSLPGGNALKFFVSVRWEVMNKEEMGKDAHDVEVVDFNQHSFKVTKNKIGNGIRTGEFKLIRNPASPLGVGFIDEGKTVLTFAKKFNMFGGGGASWRIDGINEVFRKMDDAIDWLYDHPVEYEDLKIRLITQQRTNSGLAAHGWR